MSKSANESFQLKGSTLTVSVLEILNPDFEQFNNDLKNKIGEAPDFFHKIPLIVACDKLNAEQNGDLEVILKLCRTHKLKIMGVRCANDEQANIVAKTRHHILPPSKMRESLITPLNNNEHLAQEPYSVSPSKSMIVNNLVRNGAKITAQNGDLIILNSVNPGAEIHATGNIHVYGTLRGRAYAGINGDQNARIFCNNFQAELIGIATIIETMENLSALNAWEKSVQITLENDQFKFISF